MMVEPSPGITEGQIWATHTPGKQNSGGGLWQGWACGERASSRGWEAREISTVITYSSQARALEAATRLAVFMWGPIPLTVRLGPYRSRGPQ